MLHELLKDTSWWDWFVTVSILGLAGVIAVAYRHAAGNIRMRGDLS